MLLIFASAHHLDIGLLTHGAILAFSHLWFLGLSNLLWLLHLLLETCRTVTSREILVEHIHGQSSYRFV